MSFDKYWILMWKNYTIQKRHYIRGILEIICPVLVVIVCVVCVSKLTNPRQPDFDAEPDFDERPLKFDQHPPNDMSDPSMNSAHLSKIAHSPSSPWIKEFLTVALNGTFAKFESFENAQTLDAFLHREQPTNVLGIEFDDSLKGLVHPPNLFRYTLRFPDAIENRIQLPWFVATQNQLDKSFIRIFSETSVPVIEPIPFKTVDTANVEFLEYMKIVLPLALVLATFFTAAKIIKNVAMERESQLKETMRIMGLSDAVHWTAWLTSSLFIPICTFTLVTVILCSKITGKEATFENSNFFLVWIFFVFYIVEAITFCFVMSVIFQKALSAAKFGSILFILTVLFHCMYDDDFKSFNYFVKRLYCLPINTGVGQGISLILQLEQKGKGLTMSNFASHDDGQQFFVAEVLFSFVIASAFHMLLTVYIEQVFTGNIGISKPWYFPIAMVMQLFREPLISDNDDVKDQTKLDSPDHERDPQHLNVGIEIVNMTKKFGETTVVNRFSLNMFQDQITVLLGHNGCGKTTALSMMTGLLAPTSGTAILNQHDIRMETSKARSSLALCPQHILIDDLTVRQQMIFFCRLKGLHGKQSINDEIAKYANSLDFTDKLDSLSKTLSGGQKRKLSIAIALSGGSKVVMLDELPV